MQNMRFAGVLEVFEVIKGKMLLSFWKDFC